MTLASRAIPTVPSTRSHLGQYEHFNFVYKGMQAVRVEDGILVSIRYKDQNQPSHSPPTVKQILVRTGAGVVTEVVNDADDLIIVAGVSVIENELVSLRFSLNGVQFDGDFAPVDTVTRRD